MNNELINLLTSGVGGVVAGLGVVILGVRRAFGKLDLVDEHDKELERIKADLTRYAALHALVDQHEARIGKLETLTDSLAHLPEIVSRMAADIGYVRGRLEGMGVK